VTTPISASFLRPVARARQDRRWVIIDADDTLWSTQELYEAAKDEFHALLPTGLMTRAELAAQLDCIDAEAARQVGFGRERFPNSLQVTYRQVCSQHRLDVQDTVLQELKAVGERVFERPPRVYPGVPEALRLLRRHYSLALLTKGDQQIQEDRIRTSGLRRSFDHLYIVDLKDAESYRRVLRSLQVPPASCWAVGNSARSDINPALEVGIRSVMIPNQSWDFEVEQLRPGDVWVTGNMTEAAEYIVVRDRKPALVLHR
jgi:putative hydrolase of the HAD superfamily